MPIEFACPHCGARTDVDDEFAGQSGPCFSCGKAVVVPHASLSAPASSRNWSKLLSSAAVALAAVVTVGTLGVLIVFALAQLIPSASAVARRQTCADQLKQIGKALLAYHQDHGNFPPAYSTDAKGRPLLSWRVLILPHLDNGQSAWVEEMFDMSQPWDAPQNMQAASYMPQVYGCPDDPDSTQSGESSFVVVVGKGTAFTGGAGISSSALRDGPADTILVAETKVDGHFWTEPFDLKASRMRFVINGPADTDIGSRHEEGAHVLTADGKVHFLPQNLDAARLEALLTRAGGEDVDIGGIEEP